MILDKKIKVCITGQTRKHYLILGYLNLKVNDIIEIPVEHLSRNSHHKISCRCDTCGEQKILTYQCYCSYIEYNGKYYCRKCMKEKRKITLKEKYGVENVFQLDSVKKQSGETKIEKYGDKNYRIDKQREEIILEKYGCINVFQNKDVKEKSIKTMNERHGVSYPSMNKIIKEKIKSSNLMNLGVEYPQQNSEVFKKSMKSNFKIGYDGGLLYQGSYEKDFLNHCKELGIIHLITKPESIKYLEKDDKRCYYHPDFYIEKLNLIIEIKSSYWWKIHKENILLKESATKEQGFNYIMILDKDYKEFDKIYIPV